MDSTIQLAKQWLDQCLANHESCRKKPTFSVIWLTGSYHMINDLQSAMPSRLLMFSTDDNVVRLVDVETIGEEVPYVALSHRWGTNETCRTTTNNLQKMEQEGVLVSDLPKTFRESVEFTRALGYSALWIDSLCIVQDDERDWLDESHRMACIYGNSICTISALDALDSEGGLFIPEMDSRRELDARAWVLQERVIPPRSFLFTANGISWECRQSDAESNQTLLENRKRSTSDIPDHPKELYAYFRDFRLPDVDIGDSKHNILVNVAELYGERDDYIPFLKAWWRFLSHYSTKRLTKDSDKFLAMSGIANTVIRWIHLQNFFGLWDHFLVNELTWYSDSTGPVPSRSEGWLVPSWTWASTNNGRVLNAFYERHPLDPNFMLKPWIGLPSGTTYNFKLPFPPLSALSCVKLELKGHSREGTVRTELDNDGKAQYTVSFESRGRFSEMEEHKFYPDAPSQFPVGSTVKVTSLMIYHYDAEYLKLPEYTDIHLVLRKLAVVPGMEGNLHEDGTRIRYSYEDPVPGEATFIDLAVNPKSSYSLEDEEIANTRTFERRGLLETTYSIIRDRKGIDDDHSWKFTRLI